MVASLLQFSNDLSLENVEDLVQDAFESAIISWEKDGIPSNPAGWIYRVCRNKAINKIKNEKRMRIVSEFEEEEEGSTILSEFVLEDQQLRLLFACAHPDLSPKVQVVITLKYVANLKVQAIAKALGMSEDGIDKLLLRARQKIKDEKLLLKEPLYFQLKSRLPIVHKIIYLIYNEGYRPSSGEAVLNEEFCGEALMLNKSILDNKLGDSDTSALHALMLFNSSRFSTRFGPDGGLLDLEEQDRSKWTKALISLGCDYLKDSSEGPISVYHYEASIAYLHCVARDFQSTDWKSISSLYKKILSLNTNPFVELNYAIALYYAGEKKQAIQLLEQLRENAFLNQYYLLNASLGKIYLLEGDTEKSKEYFSITLKQTQSPAEKDFILRLMKRAEK